MAKGNTLSVYERIRDWLDAPRYCPDCGRVIVVVNMGAYDKKTGAPRDLWVWQCPEVHLTVTHRGITRAEQRGDAIHPYGEGRPRWHRRRAEVTG